MADIPSLVTPEFFVAGGTVPPDSPSYVERSADRELFEALLAGEYCYVLNSRQMGKSSLAVRTLQKLVDAGVRTAFIDLTRLGGSTVGIEQWTTGLLFETGRMLGLRAEAAAFLKEARDLGPTQRFLTFLSDVVLAKIDGPVVIMIDEIDATRSLSFSTDELFAGVRQLHNARASDPDFRRLTFCLLGAALPADLIRDPRVTPFNVGRRIELMNFTPAEARPFARQLGPDGERRLSRVLYWTGGHPFLTQSLCAALGPEDDVDALVRERYLDARARDADSNLVDVGNRLLGRGDPSVGDRERADTLDLYARMRKRGVPDDEANPAAARIKMSGIARTEGGTMRVRNRIYEQAFDQGWIEENMPGQELRRLRRAYLAGVIRTAFGAGAILAIIATLLGVAVLNAARANRAEAEARRQRDEARYETYVASIRSLPLSLELNNLHEIDRVVRAQRDFPGKGWEWGYWRRMVTRSLYTVPMDEYEFASPAVTRDGRYMVLVRKAGDALGVFDLREGKFERTIPLKTSRPGYFELRFYDNDRKLLLIGNGLYLTVDFAAGKEISALRSGASLVASSLLDEKHCLGFRQGDLVSVEIDTAKVKTLIAFDQHYQLAPQLSPDRRRIMWLEERVGSPFANLVIYDTRSWRKVTEAAPLEGWFPPKWSPDGRFIAVPMDNGRVRLMDGNTGKTLWTETLTKGFIISVAFSPDSRRMVVASLDRVAQLWEISAEGVRHLDDYLDASYAFFIPKSPRVATLYFELRAYDPLAEPSTPAPEAARHWYQTMLAPDGRFVGWTGKELDQLDFRYPGRRRTSRPFPSTPMRFDQDALTYCRRVDGEQRREVAEIATGKVLHRVTVQGTEEEGFVYDRSPDGRFFVLYLTVFDMATGKPVGRIRTDGPGTQARFSRDSRFLLVSDKTGLERYWRVGKWDAPVWEYRRRYGDSTSACAFSPDGTRIALARTNDHAIVLDAATGEFVSDLVGHTNPVVAVAWAADGRRLATFGEDRTVRVWDPGLGRELCILGRHDMPGYDLRFLPGGDSLVSVDGDGGVKYWIADMGRGR